MSSSCLQYREILVIVALGIFVALFTLTLQFETLHVMIDRASPKGK